MKQASINHPPNTNNSPNNGGQTVHRPASIKFCIIFPFDIQSCCFTDIDMESETILLPQEFKKFGISGRFTLKH